MRISIASIGSRGDVEPYVALGLALARAGHSVRIATSDPFRSFVVERGLEFASLGGDIRQLVPDAALDELRAARGRLAPTFRAIDKCVGPMIREGLHRLAGALAGSEVVIGTMLVPGASAYAERYGVPYFEAAYDPLVPTRAFAHPGAPVTTPSGIAAWLSFIGAEQLFWQACRSDVDAFRRQVLGLNHAPFWGPGALRIGSRPPTLMGYSEEVIPRPPDWPAQVAVTGYWFLDEPPGWTPPPRLVEFIDAGEAPIYVGFGSMRMDNPQTVARMLLDALRRTNQRAIFARGWGGLAIADDGHDVLFVEDVPHAWLFPRMRAVVHHGGPGTTAAAFRAGVPQLVVPFLADQPFWGHQVARLGVGPAPVPIDDLTPQRLSEAVQAMIGTGMRQRAEHLGRRVRAERGGERAVELIHRHLSRGLAAAGARRKRDAAQPLPRRPWANDVFAPMPAPAKADFAARYLSYLRQRDGEPCLATRTLAHREAFFHEMDQHPVRRTGPAIVDQAVFDRNLTRKVPEPGLDEPTLWALAMAKTNRAERHGIEYKLRVKGFERGGAEDVRTHIEIQELYHTHILIKALDVIGLRAEIGAPQGLLRVVVELAGSMPHVINTAPALATEIVGLTLFRMLLGKARELFSDQPEPLARMEALLGQILVDELGHIRFLQSLLGPVRLAAARAFLPAVLRALFKDVPELPMLLGHQRLTAEVLRADIEGTASPYPDRPPTFGEDAGNPGYPKRGQSLSREARHVPTDVVT